MLKALRRKLKTYERYLLPLFLLAGLVVDFFTFQSLNTRLVFLLLGVHLGISGSVLIFLNWYDQKKTHKRLASYVRLIAPYVLQFSFGALLSASFIFYWFSGAFSVSWPFILLIAILMVSNDVFRDYYLRPIVQTSVFFFILFSVSTLVLPFIFRSIDEWVWIFSGSFSLLFMYGAVEILSRWLSSYKKHKGLMIALMVLIFAFMNGLYFLRIIPPIPLAIRDAGVYYSVERSEGDYIVTDVRRNSLEGLLPGKKMEIIPGERLYIFSAIFAPTDLGTVIVHEWEYKGQNGWETRSAPYFTIAGGRDAGFRGWSFNSHMTEGKWRVSIQTLSGQVLGRIPFTVVHVDEKGELIELVK